VATYYFDTSALIKRYLMEPGSEWVQQITDARTSSGQPYHTIALSAIGIVEAVAAIARRYRLGQLDQVQHQGLINLFLTHSRVEYHITTIRSRHIDLATALVQRHPLRGYDAIHLATALALRDELRAARLSAPIFVAADTNLCVAARAEGLPAENPNDHAT
jgi:predicted nucleic acid-binding protein